MNPAFEQQVREHAYQIWLAHGMADGLAHEHWIAAERTLLETPAAKPQKARAATPRAKATKATPAAVKTVKAKAAPAKAKVAAKPVKAAAAPRSAKASAGASVSAG